MNAAIFAQATPKAAARAPRPTRPLLHKVAELARFSPVHRTASTTSRHLEPSMARPARCGSTAGARLLALSARTAISGVLSTRACATLLADHLDVGRRSSPCDALKRSVICAQPGVEDLVPRPALHAADVTIDALLASACRLRLSGRRDRRVPLLGTVAIWATRLSTVIYYCDSRDVAIRQINPLLRKGTPHSQPRSSTAVNRSASNSSLIARCGQRLCPAPYRGRSSRRASPGAAD